MPLPLEVIEPMLPAEVVVPTLPVDNLNSLIALMTPEQILTLTNHAECMVGFQIFVKTLTGKAITLT